MKIGFDIRVLSTGRITGVEEYTLELAKHLSVFDIKDVFTFYYSGVTPLSDSFFKDKNVIYGKTPNRFLDLSFKFASRPYIDELVSCDLFFSPHFLLTPLKSAQRILTVHDLSFLRFPEFFSLKHRFWLNFMEVKKQIKQADKIVAPSDCTKNDLVTLLDVPEGKIERIYHGVNKIFEQRYEKEDLIQFRREHGLPEHYILYLGTIEPRKNITTLIKAFELLCDEFPDTSLVLAGNLGWLFERCLHAINTSKHKDKIILTRVASEDRPKLYQAAQVFVYPSFFEGFGFQPLEAQYSYVPVVASNRSSLPEILGDSALLIDPYNRLDLADAIRTTLKEEKVRNILIRKGRENAVQFNWDSAAKHYIKLFASMY